MKTIEELHIERVNEISAQDVGALPAHRTNEDYKAVVADGLVPYSFPISGDATTREKRNQ